MSGFAGGRRPGFLRHSWRDPLTVANSCASSVQWILKRLVWFLVAAVGADVGSTSSAAECRGRRQAAVDPLLLVIVQERVCVLISPRGVSTPLRATQPAPALDRCVLTSSNAHTG